MQNTTPQPTKHTNSNMHQNIIKKSLPITKINCDVVLGTAMCTNSRSLPSGSVGQTGTYNFIQVSFAYFWAYLVSVEVFARSNLVHAF